MLSSMSLLCLPALWILLSPLSANASLLEADHKGAGGDGFLCTLFIIIRFYYSGQRVAFLV
jgi:hypothetical protein